jgi:3-mercaptopyruvate sulfurtransferase SseA
VALFMADRGFKAAALIGGIAAWRAAGHPVERLLPPPGERAADPLPHTTT